MIEGIKKNLNGSKGISLEYRDYILKKEVYHCTQHDLEKNNNDILDLDYLIYMTEQKHIEKQEKREKQKREVEMLNKK